MHFQFGRLILAASFGGPLVALAVHDGLASLNLIGGFNVTFYYHDRGEVRGTVAWQRRAGATTRYAHLLPV